MLERFRLSNLSRQYRLRSAELARDKKQKQQCVTVLFLDDTTHTFRIEKRSKGGDLLEEVYQFLELSERDYFGLLFPSKPGDVVRWVDAQKLFKKQCNSVALDNEAVPLLEFRVKFYVSDPSRLQEEYTRYQFYLQIKRNILLGKLPCSLNTQCLLASYTVQSELGDFNPSEHKAGYLSNMQLLVDQTPDAERKISELHKLHRGQLPADAEYNYLEHAKRLDLYGIDLHKAMDSNSKELQLGVSAIGLLVFQNGLRINTFSWSKMVKVSFKRKDFFIQLRREPCESYDTLLGFSMSSHKHAKSLWKSCVEHHSFFRLKRPHRLSRFLNLSLGSNRFYYSGRTELQAVQESKQRAKIHKVFVRSPSKRLITIGPTGATLSPLANGASGSDSNGSVTHNGKAPSALATPHTSILTITKTSRPHHDNKVTSKQLDTMPRKAWEQQSDEYDIQLDAGYIDQCGRRFESPVPAYSTGSHSPNAGISTFINGCSKMQPESGSDLITIRLLADEHGRFGFNVKGGIDLSLPVQVSKVVPNTPADRCTPRVCEGDEVVLINGREVMGLKHEQVVNMIKECRNTRTGELLLTMRPCSIGPLTEEEEPLYQYVPETDEIGSHSNLLDGDALFTQSLLLLSDGLASGALLAQYELMYRKNPDLAITEARKPENVAKNRYRDISPYDCTRVTLVNNSSGDYINANYVNMEIPGGINRYIATQGPLASTTTDFWRMVQQESSHLVVMLTTVMEAGRQKCHQYWPVTGDELQLGEGLCVKCLSEKPDETGSFVFREFLLCDRRTGEQRHIQHMQYLAWPDHCVPSDPNLFLEFVERVRNARNRTLLQEIEESLKQVRLLDADADENGGIMSERKCAASNGVTPEDETPVSTSIHQCISAANPPVIVHCSAGIGRTGVLILMDTALALMEAREPVYPLDIVRTMRDQRACMVQNVSQYRFVCECICAAYMKLSRNSAVLAQEEDEEDDDESGN
ncbi:protein tyrosine phosphatase Meg isoform X1 [Haematobia irritans]|uniref:protein tyrosine phosphatase Meg isoform X1 n=1 Tax=Haematobia irritans TaxID=7368 RepID=UPI003F5087CF